MRNRILAGALAHIKPGIWIAFNSLRTLTIGIGIVVGFAMGTYAFEFGTTLGTVAASGSVIVLMIAMWLIWRPEDRVVPDGPNNTLAHDSMLWLQRQARFRNLKRWLSVIGAFVGACAILLVSFVVFFGGSPVAGLCFFCSGAMAMRVAWTLIRVQRNIGGKDS